MFCVCVALYQIGKKNTIYKKFSAICVIQKNVPLSGKIFINYDTGYSVYMKNIYYFMFINISKLTTVKIQLEYATKNVSRGGVLVQGAKLTA
jgi:hypothetical protein